MNYYINQLKRSYQKSKKRRSEAVVFVACNAIGLNTNSTFQDYIQLYKGDKETILKSFERIQKVAGRYWMD